jgi:hypothetical protein
MNQLTRCDRLIQIRAPEFLTKALDSAADKRLTSRSAYIRIALLRLRAEELILPQPLRARRTHQHLGHPRDR